jgi:casein kinase II subunit alpha
MAGRRAGVPKEEGSGLARVYAEVNNHRPKEYWDYESIVVEWGYAKKPRTTVKAKKNDHTLENNT